MDGSQRQAIRVAVDAEVRQRLKEGRGVPVPKSGQTGSWIPAIERVQQQHIYSAMRAEYGSWND